MKKAFEILVFTLLELILYILLLSGFYYVFCTLILESMGNPVQFSLSYLVSCIIRFTPPCAIFSIMLLIFNFIKRNCSFSEMIFPYTIVSALVWILLVPFSLRYDSLAIPGFTWWISRIPSEIDVTGLFTLPAWTTYLLYRFEILHDQLVYFFQGSNLSFGLMQYSSFFLSLAAIGCFARFSHWRLWNAFFVIFAFGFSVVLNSYLFDFTFMSTLGLDEFWSKWLPLFINCGIFLIYTLFGLFSLIASARKERR